MKNRAYHIAPSNVVCQDLSQISISESDQLELALVQLANLVEQWIQLARNPLLAPEYEAMDSAKILCK